MSINRLFKATALILISFFLFVPSSYSGFDMRESDSGENRLLFSFFDLRDRESYVQLTNIETFGGTVHVQIFDVSNNCNENNFFDSYTGNDTHVYNLRDIQTNDTSPSGVVLPDGAYGFVSIISVDPTTGEFDNDENRIIGNFRILDNNGYEYRTNSVNPFTSGPFDLFGATHTFNFNTEGDITFSDIVGLTFRVDFMETGEIIAADILENFAAFEVDILNESEVIFSCRNVAFSCINQESPLQESLLEEINSNASASVADFEYGINNAIPHSKGGELLCPGNNISNGVVSLDRIGLNIENNREFIGYIGLNNGNQRGSMDGIWSPDRQATENEG